MYNLEFNTEYFLSVIKNLKISQNEAGRRADVNKGSLSQYVNKRVIPNAINLYKLAKALNVKAEDLLKEVQL